MSADTPVVGYPVHRVATYSRWTNPHGAVFTDWTAACGATGSESGHRPFGKAGSARRAELCRVCFMRSGTHGGYYPEPRQVAAAGGDAA